VDRKRFGTGSGDDVTALTTHYLFDAISVGGSR
jgi:hypothetical protein